MCLPPSVRNSCVCRRNQQTTKRQNCRACPANASAITNQRCHHQSRWIYFYPIDAPAAYYMNKQQLAQTNDTSKVGDLAILTAMHVATKETSNWTRQTFSGPLIRRNPIFRARRGRPNCNPPRNSTAPPRTMPRHLLRHGVAQSAGYRWHQHQCARHYWLQSLSGTRTTGALRKCGMHLTQRINMACKTTACRAMPMPPSLKTRLTAPTSMWIWRIPF